MGCGGSKREDNKNKLASEYFIIELYNLEKTTIQGEFAIKSVTSENNLIKPELKFFDYLKTYNNEQLKSYSGDSDADKDKSDAIWKNSLYIFYFIKQKFSKVRDFNYSKKYNPFDENILNDDNKIKQVSIFSMQNFPSFGIEKKDFFSSLDSLLKSQGSDTNINNKLIRIKTEETSCIIEAELEDGFIEKQMEKGDFIFILFFIGLLNIIY